MTIRVRAILVSVVVMATMWLGGCGHYVCDHTFGNATCTSSGSGISQGGGTTGSGIGVSSVVYFYDAGEMSAEGLNLSNSQTFEADSSFVTPTFSGASGSEYGFAVANEQYLYMPFGNGTVFGYSIDSGSGALTTVSGSPYTVSNANAISIAADPSGRFLFVGQLTGISVFTINSSSGSLTPVAGSPFSIPGGVVPAQLATDGKGLYLYAVASFPGTAIAAFSYDQTSGALTAVSGSPFSFPMSQISGEPSGQYLLALTQQAGFGGDTADNHVYVFDITQTGNTAGALTAASGSPFATVYPPVYFAVDPKGGFVYTFNETVVSGEVTYDPMEGYALNSGTGALTALSTSPFTSLIATSGMFDQSGEYIFASAQVPNADLGGTYPYAVDTSTGALSSTLPYLGIPSATYAVTDLP